MAETRFSLLLILAVFITACTATQTSTPTPILPTDTPVPTSTSTATPTLTLTLTTPTLTPTPSQTPIPPTPQSPDELVYNPKDSTLYDANSTPVYRRDRQGKWLAVVPEALLGILQEGWIAKRVTDEAGLELLAVTTEDGGEVFRVLPDTQVDEEGKFPAWVQVDGEREEVMISKEGLNEEELIATSSDEETTTRWSFDQENGDWEKLFSNIQKIAIQLGYTEDECEDGCVIANTIPDNELYQELRSDEKGVMGYTDVEGNWVSTKGWQEAMAEKIGPDWESFIHDVNAYPINKLDLITDGEVIRSSIDIKTKEGEVLATTKISIRGFYLDSQGKLQSVICPQVLEYPDGQIHAVYLQTVVDWSEGDIDEMLSSEPWRFNVGRRGLVSLPTFAPDVNKFVGQIPQEYRHFVSVQRQYQESWDEELQDFYETGSFQNGVVFPFGMAFGVIDVVSLP